MQETSLEAITNLQKKTPILWLEDKYGMDMRMFIFLYMVDKLF